MSFPTASTALALVRASHPGPCLAVTAITVLLAVAAGVSDIGKLTWLGASVLAGQLSIGWSNDWADVKRDAAAARIDKPVVTGDLRRAPVLAAALLAVVVAFGLALQLSPTTAAWMAPVVVGGWAYNLGLKATPLSGLAYVVGFAPLPGLATSLLPGHPAPRPWAIGAAALMGLGAHFVNVLPDLAHDRLAGVRGLPQRVAEAVGAAGADRGEMAVRTVALVLLVGASVLIAFAPGIARRGPVLFGLAVAVALALAAARTHGRMPFRYALAIAGIDVLMFAAGGGDLT
jgi:4-hydroxybenzoate polyprenyltransferase